jgi:hypothetical protein
MNKLKKDKELKRRPWQKDMPEDGVGANLKGRALGLTEEPVVPKYHMNPNFDYTSYLNELKELPEVKEKLSNLF